jgi:predicted kinase
VSVVGNSGSGKSTMAAALARRLGVPHVELDGLKDQPGWTELPRDEFAARVRTTIAGDGWVIDGNYSDVRDEIWQRADTVVWLDPHRAVVMRQIVGAPALDLAHRAVERQPGTRDQHVHLRPATVGHRADLDQAPALSGPFMRRWPPTWPGRT